MVDWAPGLEDRRSVTASVAELYSGAAPPSSGSSGGNADPHISSVADLLPKRFG